MNILGNIKLGWQALHQGEAIVAAAKVKNWTALGNGVASLAGIGVAAWRMTGHEIPITDDELKTIGSAIAILLGLFNPISAVVTSEKIGLPSVPATEQRDNVPMENEVINSRVPEQRTLVQPDVKASFEPAEKTGSSVRNDPFGNPYAGS